MSHAQTILELRIRNLIAAREFNTSQANHEALSGDGWLWDHAAFDQALSDELQTLLGEVKVEKET